MRESGIPICVGTDSLSSNDRLDIVAELECLQKAFDVPLQELLEWACLNGARFLGLQDRLGTLEPGKKPGVVRIVHDEYAPADKPSKSSVIQSEPSVIPSEASVSHTNYKSIRLC